MSSYDPEEDHPTFEEDLRNSRETVFLAARWLSARGEEITIPGFEMRGDVSERYEFQDNGDLLIKRPIEVKHRDIGFSSKRTYPYDTVFLNETYKHEENRPLFYLIFSRDHTCCIVVESRSQDEWVVERKYDRVKNREADFYAAPLRACTFKDVPRELVEQMRKNEECFA